MTLSVIRMKSRLKLWITLSPKLVNLKLVYYRQASELF